MDRVIHQYPQGQPQTPLQAKAANLQHTLRVLIAASSISKSSGGYGAAIHQLCGNLSKQGVRVQLVTSMDTEAKGLREPHSYQLTLSEPGGAGIVERLFALKFGRLIRKIVEAEAPDLMHIHGLWKAESRLACSEARSRRIPWVITPHGMLSPWAISQKRIRKKVALFLFERRDLDGARAVHATSDLEAKELRDAGIRAPIAVIANGIEIPAWAPPENGQDTRTVLFLSRIHPKKGIPDLVRAWKLLRPSGWKCVIAGPDEGGHRAQVEKLVRDESLQSDFEFSGPVDGEAKWALFRRADLFVLPTYSENFGLVVAEALACGIPAITTKAAPWDILMARQCGWWIDLGADSLARALREGMAATDAERRAMGERGRKMVEERYSWHVIAAEMRVLYAWVAGGGPIPLSVRMYRK